MKPRTIFNSPPPPMPAMQRLSWVREVDFCFGAARSFLKDSDLRSHSPRHRAVDLAEGGLGNLRGNPRTLGLGESLGLASFVCRSSG
jgi:hypothetical protein